MFIVEIFWGEKYSWMCRKTQTQILAWEIYNMLQDFISPVIDNNFKCNFIFVNMPHRIYKCTNTLYDYAIINY
jgi:hypothetical protein